MHNCFLYVYNHKYTQFVPVLIYSIVHINIDFVKIYQDEKGEQLSYKSTKIPNSSSINNYIHTLLHKIQIHSKLANIN